MGRDSFFRGNKSSTTDEFLKWDFDHLDSHVSDELLFDLSVSVCQGCPYADVLSPEALSRMKNWIKCIYGGYNIKNPYHNWRHACSVLTGSVLLLKKNSIKQTFG